MLSGITLRYGSGTHIWNVQLKTEFTLLYVLPHNKFNFQNALKLTMNTVDQPGLDCLRSGHLLNQAFDFAPVQTNVSPDQANKQIALLWSPWLDLADPPLLLFPNYVRHPPVCATTQDLESVTDHWSLHQCSCGHQGLWHLQCFIGLCSLQLAHTDDLEAQSPVEEKAEYRGHLFCRFCVSTAQRTKRQDWSMGCRMS